MSPETENLTAETAGTNRRLVLKSSLATMAAIGTGMTSSLAKANAPDMSLDQEVLNFALNLEYLEAEFYLRAVYGTGLSGDETTGKGTQGTVTGGGMVPFQSDAVRAYATEIANDERNHVDYLRKALGGKAVAEPSIDLQQSFNTLAMAAGLGDSFDPFSSEANFILGAFIFEDVGVTAYHGAATLISNKDYLDAAAGILAVEAYHAGIVRLLCYQNGLGHLANKISDLRNKLSQAAGSERWSDQGVIIGGIPNLVPTHPRTSVAFERNTTEVLNIVYAGGSSGGFGFFPDRLNGKIN
jgi:hypothetical protein